MRFATAEEIRQRAGTTWLIYGQMGMGKTPLASCFPDPWFWDCEGGTQSILFLSVPVSAIESYSDVLACLQAVQQSKDFEVKLGQHAFPCHTIVVDTMGEFARILLGSAKGAKEQATIGDWGLAIERTRNVTRQLRDLRDRGFNIVFVCHEQYLKQAETDAVMGLPDLPGKELPTDLPKLCDIVVRMTYRNTASGTERVLVAVPQGLFTGRDRLNRLDPVTVVPSFKEPLKIKELLKKGGVVYP